MVNNVRAEDPPLYSQNFMDKLHESSNRFYTDSVKGKKLKDLKPLADGMKRRIYDSLDYLKEVKLQGKTITTIDLRHTLKAIRNLKLIYSEMEIQEKRWAIKCLRIIGSDWAIGTMLIITILLVAYNEVIFGISCDLEGEEKHGAVDSAVAAEILFVILTITAMYLTRKYAQIGVSKEDLEERVFFSAYFRHFGKLEFDKCVELTKKLSTTIKLNKVTFKYQQQLIDLAKDCAAYNADDAIRQDFQSYGQQFPQGKDSKPRRSLYKKLFNHIPWLAHASVDWESGNVQVSLQDLGIDLPPLNQSPEDPPAKSDTDEPSPSTSQIFEPFDYASSDSEEEQKKLKRSLSGIDV